MHLRKVLRQVNIPSITDLYEGGVRALVIPHNSGKILHARSRAGASSTCRHKISFWEASKHAEFDALEKLNTLGNKNVHSTVILYRIIPLKHPKSQIQLTENWALGSADMCKLCVERLSKNPKAKNITWLTPDASSKNQLRPAVPTNPIVTLSFLRYQFYVKNERPYKNDENTIIRTQTQTRTRTRTLKRLRT
jgi:hypothetical protein